MSVRVRFAPSPTGFLHIGGARTALFNWLYARHTGGTFILRIEDTDVARNTQEAVEVILKGLRWLGLEWDEGPISGQSRGESKGAHGPYFQSQRSEIYRKRVQELKEKGHAYEHEGAVKFRMPREPILISDLVVGGVNRELTDREQLDPDFVIVRSDGQPVFHLVNVVDDLEMRITHVIRGEDHLSNTAKHIALFRAFGVDSPKYAHIPLILNKDGTKMSKRDKGASLMSYIDEDYLPEAVMNYLYLLGWSPKGNREIVPLEEVIRIFDLPQILRSNARFDLDKLHWLNWEHMRASKPERFNEIAIRALGKAGIQTSGFDPEYVREALGTCKEKVKLAADIPPFVDFYFVSELSYDPEATQKYFTPENKPRVAKLRETFAGLSNFAPDALQNTLKAVAAELGIKVGALVHPVRLAATGKTVGPSLYHLLAVLGKERVLKRLDDTLARMS
ncbi:MAG: glutamate--tRNA ligase [Verrucomicrobia bacterium]|nr:glutamate--tRNA ligase [Verrucomicrobiota bacterium]